MRPAPSRRRRSVSPVLVVAVVAIAAVVAAAVWWRGARGEGVESPWRTVQVERGADVHAIEAAIDELLLERHGLRDFSIRNRAALIESVEETQNTLTLLLGSIAAVSLLVGGIGVMNIMLVSVTERTREIGVRMAVGARPRDVMAQFLVEALVVCGLGALAGVALGVLVTWGIGSLGTPVVFTLPPIVGAAVCALLIGLVFGMMPARKAAQLDPVRALGAD